MTDQLYGVMGKVLYVNLSTGKIEEQTIAEEVYKTVFSGVGLGAWYLYNNIPADADPLGPDNILGFTSGVLTGTGVFYAGRFQVVCKSPASGGWGDSNCGGTFAPMIKMCGYDAIFFQGASKTPVYMYVGKNGPELRDAAKYWGMDAVEAEDALEADLWKPGQRKPRIALIGQAGEKLSLISGVCNDRGRIAARGGGGAVMGSKKLKAVVLCGNKQVKVHDQKAIKDINKEYAAKIRAANFPDTMKNHMLYYGTKQVVEPMRRGEKMQNLGDGMAGLPMIFKKWGTCATTASQIPDGDSPMHNWLGVPDDVSDEDALKLSADTLIAKEHRKYHCYSCALGCGGIVNMEDNRYGNFKEMHKPEYESMGAFGALCDNFDQDSILYCTEIVNRAGMDSISAGALVAWTIEMMERGIITEQDLGFKITWGDSDGIVRLTEMLANREGFGDVLADGIKVACERIGRGAEEYTLHIGGIEPGMHDGRKGPGGWGAFYPMDATPGKHTTASVNAPYTYQPHLFVESMEEPDPYKSIEEYVASGKMGERMARGYINRYMQDSWGVCFLGTMTGFQHWKVYDFLRAATGWDLTGDDIWRMGKAATTLRQLFNAKHGYRLDEVYVHPRFMGGLTRGPNAYRDVPYQGHRYYTMLALGWDADSGAPTNEAVVEVGLDKILEYDYETCLATTRGKEA